MHSLLTVHLFTLSLFIYSHLPTHQYNVSKIVHWDFVTQPEVALGPPPSSSSESESGGEGAMGVHVHVDTMGRSGGHGWWVGINR
jgi:hypothetical protein